MSFRRVKANSKTVPEGCRISTLNGQILTSTGIASLDEIMAGGVPAGRVLMIKKDRNTGYAELLLKYWITQGLAHNQPIVFASLDTLPETYMVDLMGIVDGKQESSKDEEIEEFIPQIPTGRQMGALRTGKPAVNSDKSMAIAWRYERLPQLSSTPAFKGPNSTF